MTLERVSPRRPPLYGPLPRWLAYRGPHELNALLTRTNEVLDNEFACSLRFPEDLLSQQAWLCEAAYRLGVRWVQPTW